MRDRIGLAFFTFAAVVSFLAAWEHPSMLAWLAGLHNAVLAVIYAQRKPACEIRSLGALFGTPCRYPTDDNRLLCRNLTSLDDHWHSGILLGFLVAYFVRESLWNCSCRSWAGRVWPVSYCAASDVPGRAGIARCAGDRINPGASCRRLAHCSGCDPDPACRTRGANYHWLRCLCQPGTLSPCARSMVMTLRLFPLIAYLASSAYLVCWMIHLSWAIYQRVRSWAHPPRMMLSLKSWSKIGEENGIYVYFIGILFGGLATLWLMHIFIREWLLVIFVVLAVLSDEMQVSSTETLLLEVMIFFDRLAESYSE